MANEPTNLGAQSSITLREVTLATLYPVCKLSYTLSEAHKHMVADNAYSIAEAHFCPNAWFRAIYADETPVGFLMVDIGTKPEEHVKEPGYFLWRMMIGAPYQGRGFGRRALELVMDKIRTEGGTVFRTSCGEGEGSPEGFYHKLGFHRDGKMYDDEVGLRLELGSR